MLVFMGAMLSRVLMMVKTLAGREDFMLLFMFVLMLVFVGFFDGVILLCCRPPDDVGLLCNE